jgi:serine protease inhibitor
MRQTEIEVIVPKFKIETTYSLNQVLAVMGMKSVFTPSADLSGIGIFTEDMSANT